MRELLKVIAYGALMMGVMVLVLRGVHSFFEPVGLECGGLERERPCAFGGGVVGRQECWWGEWQECEAPKPPPKLSRIAAESNGLLFSPLDDVPFEAALRAYCAASPLRVAELAECADTCGWLRSEQSAIDRLVQETCPASPTKPQVSVETPP